MGKSCVLGKASVWMLKSPRMMTGVIVAIATWNPEDRGKEPPVNCQSPGRECAPCQRRPSILWK